jgi:MarR family transcriptional regulator, organic hydroperoxide resistance regulator
MENKVFDSFGFLLMHIGRAHHSLIRKQMHGLGLHRGQPPVLFALHKQDGMSNSELAEFLEITPATLTNKVKRMEKARLVVRQRDPEDERVNRIYLTEKGRGLMDRLRQSVIEQEKAILKGFDETESQRLKNNMLKILKNMEDYEQILD